MNHSTGQEQGQVVDCCTQQAGGVHVVDHSTGQEEGYVVDCSTEQTREHAVNHSTKQEEGHVVGYFIKKNTRI